MVGDINGTSYNVSKIEKSLADNKMDREKASLGMKDAGQVEFNKFVMAGNHQRQKRISLVSEQAEDVNSHTEITIDESNSIGCGDLPDHTHHHQHGEHPELVLEVWDQEGQECWQQWVAIAIELAS